MKRSDIIIIPDYFKHYVSLVPKDLDVLEALDIYGPKFVDARMSHYTSLGDKTYKSGKWNVKQIFVHLIDSERIFAYRALRFARNDNNELPGFEQDDYVRNAQVSHRSLIDIIDEFKVVRESTICLYKSLNASELKRSGIASGMEMSVLALGFVIAGHLIHHQNVLEEKYYPLIQ